jgi:hypothetical protein
MANVTYYISASYIGTALEGAEFYLYHTECDVFDNLIDIEGSYIITSSSLATGITFTISDSIEKVYLLPLSPDCPLGCGYNYTITLDQYVGPSPTPTITPTATPAASVAATPTPTVTPTPSVSGGIPFVGPYGSVSMSRNGAQLRFVWSSSDYSTYQRVIYAQQLSTFLAGTYVGQSLSETSPTTGVINKDFDVYNNAKTLLLARAIRSASPTVYYFDDGSQMTLVANNVDVLPFTSAYGNFYYRQYTS